MSTYQPGDYVKVEFRDDSTGESEWMWVKAEHADDEEEVVFGQLDNEPIVNKGLHRGMELAGGSGYIAKRLNGACCGLYR